MILPPIKVSAEEEIEIVKDQGFGANEISAYIPVFTGCKNINNYRKSKVEWEISKKERALTKDKIEEELTSIYFEILNIKKQIDVCKLASKSLNSQKDRIKILFENGNLVPKSELLKIDASIEENESLILENISNKKLLISQINLLLNYPLDKEYELSDFDFNEFISKNKNYRNILAKDLEKTKLVENEKLKLEISKYNLEISKADLYPKLYIKPTFQYQDKENLNGETYLKKRAKSDRYALEIGFSWTFQWGGTLDNVSEKKWLYEKAKLLYEDNLRKIKLETNNLSEKIEILKLRNSALKNQENYLKENLNIDKMRYEAGLLSTFEYLDSINKYKYSKIDYNESLKQTVLYIIKLNNIYREESL